jgi:hypothetical protein
MFQSGTDGYKITKYNLQKLKKKNKNIDEYIIDETVVKAD